MTINRDSLAGLILTGGESTRMGRPKATLPLAGKPLWTYAAGVLSRFTDHILLVGSVGAFVPPPPMQIIPDDPAGFGPIGGLATGLEQSARTHNLVLAVDYPLTQPALLQLILDRATGHQAVCGRSDSFLEPLVAYYHAGCASEIRRMIDAGEIRTHKLFERVPSIILDDEEYAGADPMRLSQVNVNTPDDVRRAERLLAQ